MIMFGAEFNVFKGTNDNIAIVSSNFWYKEADINTDAIINNVMQLIPHNRSFKSHLQFLNPAELTKFQFNVTYHQANNSIVLIKSSETKYPSDQSESIIRNILS